MTKAEILERLRESARLVDAEVQGVRMFVFGSLVQNESSPEDVDVLVVYDSETAPGVVRRVLEPLSRELPLHLLFLSVAEEAELAFVAGQACVTLR